MTLELSPQQQNAKDKIFQFICDPSEQFFVLEGFAGTGKSTLIKDIVDSYPNFQKTLDLLGSRTFSPNLVLTATTHKAAENLSVISGMDVKTIHSTLGLRLFNDFKTGTTKLVPNNSAVLPTDSVILVDEASYLNKELFEWIKNRTSRCKIIFIGDPAQLLNVGAEFPYIFSQGFKTVRLTDVRRNSGPILELATKFRETVMTGEWFSFKPDNQNILHLNRDDFNAMVASEFTRPDWNKSDSRVLSWTNERGIEYNKYITSLLSGDASFKAGDYGVVNNYVYLGNDKFLKAQDTVFIQNIWPNEIECDVLGYWVVSNKGSFFTPYSRNDVKAATVKFQNENNIKALEKMSRWVDLRGLYAETVNKAQGSTYKKVFIDLDDIVRVSTGNTLARLLYVATSRASEQVIFTGDIV